MKISYKWLSDFIQNVPSSEEIGKMLTGCGLEVEDISNYHSIPGGLNGIVIGHVLSAVKHPNADKLRVCKVDIGGSEPKQIVCGAPNVAEGQKVLVATVGTTVYPTQGEPFTINKAKIRGEVSEGMICAEDELSLGASHEGIMVLPDSYVTGKPASDYFPVYSDELIEIGLTANRGDAASHYGVARDLYALGLEPAVTDVPELIDLNTNTEITVELKEGSGCLRYSGISIRGVTVMPSPEWLQNRLKVIGINPINNIVDATNYILHSWGQPLHAFDSDKIAAGKIIVRKAEAGEKITTLDKTERTLIGHECLITDQEKVLALAGVFGGMSSGITSETRNIFIESAWFHPVAVRKAARSHGLNTDASFRFERGTDPEITVTALKRVSALILELAGGKVSSGITDIYPEKMAKRVIVFNPVKSNELIGKNIPDQEVKRILHALEITIDEKSETHWDLSVPAYRPDVERAIDITEEILRIYGLNNIEMGHEIKSAMTFSAAEAGLKIRNKIAVYLSDNGFYEMATNSLTKSAYYPEETLAGSVKLLNPLSQEMDIMRPDFVYSALEALQYNNNRKNSDVRLFEMGKTYHLSGNGNEQKNYSEHKHLILAMTGRKMPESWNNSKNELSYFGLKAIIELVLAKCGIHSKQYTFEEDLRFENATQLVIKKQVAGTFGNLNKTLTGRFDLDKPVWYADLNLDLLIKLASEATFKLRAVPVFPAVRRDLALVVDGEVSFAQLEKIALKTEPVLIRQVNAFDVYQGDKIEKGKKSYALSFILQDDTKTLTDEEIEGTIKKLIDNFGKETGAVLRG